MGLKIREATTADALSIDKLCILLGYESHQNRTTTSLHFVINDPCHCVFVAEDESKIIGWIHAFLAVRLESDSFVEIGGLVVDDQHRKKGIGRILISHAQSWALSQNVNKLRVRCNFTRKETHDFYIQLGFQITKEQKVFDLKLTTGTELSP